jgi:hypothetical protein
MKLMIKQKSHPWMRWPSEICATNCVYRVGEVVRTPGETCRKTVCHTRFLWVFEAPRRVGWNPYKNDTITYPVARSSYQI